MEGFYKQKLGRTRKLSAKDKKVLFQAGSPFFGGMVTKALSSNSRLVGLKFPYWEGLKLQLAEVLNLGGA